MAEVLYLSYDGITDPLGRSQVLPYLEGLSAAGYRIHLISFEKQDAFSRDGATVKSRMQQASIQWYPLKYTKNPPVLSTLFDIRQMYQKSLLLIKQHHIRLIHCRSYISGITGLRLKKATGAALLFDMRGFWADERVEGKIWNLSNPVYRTIYQYFKRKEKELLSEADGVISLTHAAKKVIDAWGFRDPGKLPVEVIPCCADLSLFSRDNPDLISRQRAFTNELQLENQGPVISYLGAIGTWYLLDEMMQFFSLLLQKHPNAVFLFITRENPATILKAATAFNVPHERIRIRAAVREEIPALLSLSQASVFFILPSFSKTASSPTKQAEIMGMGIPLICNSGVGDTDYVVNKYRCGISVDLSDPDALNRAVSAFESLDTLNPESIRAGASEFYALSTGISRYREYYEKILKQVS